MKIRLCTIIVYFISTLFLHSQNKNKYTALPENATSVQVKVFLDSSSVAIKKSFYAGNYAEAIALSNNALQLSSEHGTFYPQFEIRSFLGNTYLRLDDIDKAQETLYKNYSEAKIFKDEEVLMGTTIDLGNLYRLQNKQKKAIAQFLEAGTIAEKRKDARRIFIANYNIAEIYIENKKDINLAAKYLNQAEKQLVNLDDLFFNASLESMYGNYYLSIGEAKKSINHFQQSIVYSKKVKHVDGIFTANEGLVKAQELAGNYRESLQTFKILDSLKQKQFALDKEEYKQSIENKQQNETIKQQLHNKELENELIMQRAYANKIILYAALGLTLILGIFLFSLLRASKKRKKLILDLEYKNKKYLEAKKQTEKLAKDKAKFFSTVTHDLRTPLYGIIGLTNTLVDDPELASHQYDLKALKFSADYLLALINDVLQVNKLDSKKGTKLDSQQFSIQDLMKDIIDSLQYMKTQNNNTLNVILDENLPKYIIGDRLKLSQILMNLIANALKFTTNGHVLVSVLEESRNTKQVFLRFEIKDNGIGIPQEQQKVIFEEFGQLNEKNLFHGSGLGLNIVSKLLHQMGGKIELESEDNQGSLFYFKLKFALAENVKEDDSGIILSEKLINLHGKKVLIVEDNLVNQLVTKKILSKYLMLFDVANNGLEAVQLVKDNKYDLILMDINMPVLDGIEATKQIRDFNTEVPILLLTAVELIEIDDRIQNLKFNDVIIKPYALNSFLNTLLKNMPS